MKGPNGMRVASRGDASADKSQGWQDAASGFSPNKIQRNQNVVKLKKSHNKSAAKPSCFAARRAPIVGGTDEGASRCMM
jgi:hypothetical protein